MTTIILPPDLEVPLAEAARQQGTTPALLALDCLRQYFLPAHPPTSQGNTLFDFLEGYAGTVHGSTEAVSEQSGIRFTKGLLEKQRQGHL
jgi:hypothetical protein